MLSRLVLAALLTLASLPGFAQVAPAVTVGGLPLGIGAGFSDFSVDYGTGRRMIGVSVWADYNLFHGLGLTAEGTSILGDKPAALVRMRQDTIQGGVVYKTRPIFRVRPVLKYMAGIGSIDFPSDVPNYTHDTYQIASAVAGGEYHLTHNVFAHAEYEYQWWHDFRGSHSLNPNGFTIGATYYLRGVHRNY